MSIIIDYDGLDDARAAFRRLIDNAQNSESLIKSIMEHETGLLKERFESETAPDGSRWKPSLRKLLKGGKTLTDTGKLKRSIGNYASSERGAFGTNTPLYEKSHQFGVTIRPVRAPALAFRLASGKFVKTQKSVLPRRAFLPVDGDEIDVKEWFRITIEHLFND